MKYSTDSSYATRTYTIDWEKLVCVKSKFLNYEPESVYPPGCRILPHPTEDCIVATFYLTTRTGTTHVLEMYELTFEEVSKYQAKLKTATLS